jgi:nucleolar pre-ribosomal-associated protein 1
MGTPAVVDIRRVVCLVEHRLFHAEGRDHLSRGLLILLASILEGLSLTMSSTDILALKEFVFVRSGIIKTSLMSESLSDVVRDGMYDSCVCVSSLCVDRSLSSGYHQLVKSALDPKNEDDRMLVSDISCHWLQMIKTTLRSDIVQVCFLPTSFIVLRLNYDYDDFRFRLPSFGQNTFILRISWVCWICSDQTLR